MKLGYHVLLKPWRRKIAKVVRDLNSGAIQVVSGKHFHYEIGYDDHGITVTVIHKPTGRRKLDRPQQGEEIPAVQRRLVRDLLYVFFDEKDFVGGVGRRSIDGQYGDQYSITHLPTKRSKSLNTITNPNVKNPHETLLDLLVEELWREGLLPKVEGSPRSSL